LCLFGAVQNANAQLKEHGIVAPVSESRGVIAANTSSGEPIIITVAKDNHHGHTRTSLSIPAANKARVVKVQNQLPGLRTISMRALPDGILIGGTSIAAPGGGKRIAQIAVLYLMDAKTEKVLFKTVPVSSGADITSLEVKGEKIYGVTADSQLFVFDIPSRKVLLTKTIQALGSPIRAGQSLLRGDDGTIYGVFSKAIFRIDADFKIEKLADLPNLATAGIAWDKGTVYFACGAKLWSFHAR
jgi:hypothetical protein